MTYALFWIETVVLGVLISAALAACLGRLRRAWLRLPLLAASVLLPLLPAGIMAGVSAMLTTSVSVEYTWVRYWVPLAVVQFIAAAIAAVLAPTGPLASRRARDTARLPWPRAKVALAAAVAAAVWTMTLWNMDLSARSRAESLRVDAAATILSIAPPNVPDSQNAAPLYQRAFDRIQADGNWQRQSEIFRPLNLSAANIDCNSPVVREVLARHAETVAILLRAAAMPDCAFEHEYGALWAAMRLPEVSSFRHSARLLSLHARAEVNAGRVDNALRDVNAMFRMAEHTARAPLLLCALVALAIDGMAVSTLQAVLPHASTAEQVDIVKLDRHLLPRRVARAMRGEEAFGLSVMADIASGRMGIYEVRNWLGGGPSPWPAEAIIDPPLGAIYRVFYLPEDERAYRTVMAAYIRLSNQPYHVARPQITQVEREMRRAGFLASALPVALSAVFRSHAVGEAGHSTAAAALAAARYRIQHGRLPAKLADLVGLGLDETPLDPFDGQPLRMKVADDGALVIYSIGPDGKDDGGAPYELEHRAGDIAFRLPAKR